MRPRRKHTHIQRLLFAVKPQTSSDITKARLLFTQFMAEYNLPASVADGFIDLVKVMFSNSYLLLAMFVNSTVRKMVKIFPHEDRVINE